MTESHKSVFKKRFHAVVGAVLVLGIYATGFINCLINSKYSGNFNFLNIIKAFFCCKTTLVIYPAIVAIIGGIGVAIINKSWKDGLLDDKMGRRFRYSEKISPYGDAHVMEPHEYVDVAQIRKLEDCKGVIVGQLTEDGEECIDFNPKRINSHMFISAMSGSGKTYGFVKPYIFQAQKRRHSLVMTDPKGELYTDTAGYLMDNGYKVRRLDFKNLEKSDGWDCLKTLHGKDMRTKVQIFSNAVISNINPKDSDSIFAKGSESLLQALILRVLLGHDFPESEKNIRSVYNLLQNPGGYEFLATMFDKNSLTEEEMPCLPPYLVYSQGSENLRSNIATHLANGLQLFQDDLLCNVLSTDDIDLTLPGKEPCAYYCVFPDDHDTYKFVISLFFTMFFIELIDYADSQPNLKLPVGVDFLLDEFPSIGIIPDWAKKMSTIRSRGISAVMITQDFTQLKQNYRDTWPTILNNCGALITLGINEMETADWISKRIGETSIEVESTSETNVAGQRRKDLVKKDSIGVGKRSLFTASEIFEIGQDNNLVIIAGRNPIMSKKTPFTIFPDAEKLRPIKKDELINIQDKADRKVLRDCEDEYDHNYWATHSLKPSGDPSDLSDALYTEPNESPIAMITAIIKEDMSALIRFIKRRILHREDVQMPVEDDTEEGEKPVALPTETAEKGAFESFYEDYKTKVGAASFMEESDFELDNDFSIDESTGEVLFSDQDNSDMLFGDRPGQNLFDELDTSDDSFPKEEAEEIADEKPAPDTQKADTASQMPKFKSAKKKSDVSNYAQKSSDEGQSQSSGFFTPPTKKAKNNIA